MRDKREPAPNSVATKSKLKRPTRPQFKPPTMRKIKSNQVQRFD
jgi:hypothetical protein